MKTLAARLAALLLTLAAVAPAAAQLLPPLPGGSLIVTLTSPGQGATVSGTIPVSASVSLVGTLTLSRVEFFRNGNFIGSDAGAPYSVSWNTTTVGNGSHTLTAVAVDVLGVRWTSNAVTVNVSNGPPPDTTAPSVSLTTPANGATVSGTISVTASASDNVGVVGVQFLVDGVVRADDASPPYSVSWDTATVGNGSHTLTAVARDAAGNTRTSSPVTVSVSNGPPPDTTAPSVSITSPANGATVSGTITVRAGAADDAGVAGVQLLLDGVAAGPVLTTAPYELPWDTTGVGDGAHTIAAVAADAAGNRTTSATVTVTVANGGGAGTVRFEQTNPAVLAAGTWLAIGPEIAAFSGGTAGASNTPGATVTFTFSGSSVSWLGLRCNACGIATVSLDGGAPATVDTAGPGAPDGSLASEVVFSASGLDPAASHTLVITVTGNTNSGGAYVAVDAFDVTGGGASGLTRIEQDAAAVSYAGTWVRDEASPIASGGSFSESNVAGATASLDFTGTEVRWLGYRYAGGGIARISVDGTFVGEVDTYAASAALDVVFAARGLAPGPHTLTIEVTGTSAAAAFDSWVVVDAFDVTP